MKISELFEARRPDLKYTEKRIKDVLDRVTVELKGNESGTMSKLTTRYARLDKSAKLLAQRRDEVNAGMKEAAEELFEASDAVLTRVVDTVSFVITLSKAEKAADKKAKFTVDYAKIVEELGKMMPELEGQIKELTSKFTESVPLKDSPVALRVKSKVDEGVMDTLKSWFKSLKTWLTGYDKKLASLKAMLPVAEGLKSHQAKTTLKHIKNPSYTQRVASADIKPGVAGYRDRIDLLKAAKQKGNLKKNEVAEAFIASVETKWSPPEGFFEKSSEAVAKGLKSASKDLKQAMSRLNFYINRAGKNLSDEDHSRLEAAKTKLSALYK